MNIDFTNVPKHYAARTHEKMQEVLMDPDSNAPEIHYYMIRGGAKQRNITVWEIGTVGGEYIKAYGHYHIGKLAETYWFIFGTGIVLMQKLATDENGELIADQVEEFKVVNVKQGEELFIPEGYGHLVVNTGDTYLVTADDSPVEFEDKDPASLPGHADYKPVQQMRGFAYYVIEHNGKPVLRKNPLYKSIAKEELDGLEVVE